jgi:hypothetical protein
MRVLIRTTYANPERLREGVNENGLRVVERVPGHATRPARPWELNTWEQESTATEAAMALAAGGTVRFAR